MAKYNGIFVVGHGRSGTTLLSILLGQHYMLAPTPETDFINGYLRGVAKGLQDHDLFEYIMSQTRIQDLRLENDQIWIRACKLSEPSGVSASNMFQAILEGYAIKLNKKIAVEKTPDHLKYLDLIHSWFPHAKIVWILRDGRSVVESLLRMEWASNNIVILCLQWIRNIKWGLAFRARHPSCVYLMRYEELVNAKEDEMLRLYDYIGLTPNREMNSNHYDSLVVPGWESGWKARSLRPIDVSRIDSWRNELSYRNQVICNALLAKQLKQLNYEVDDIPIWAFPFVVLGAMGGIVASIIYGTRASIIRRRIRKGMGAASKPLTCDE